ncbi:hypothetical protein ACWFMI_12125 [Nocardiopsis terrae]
MKLSTGALALLRSLLRDVPGDHHVLTLHTHHTMSTAVDRRAETFDAEHPQVVERLHAAVTGGAGASVVLRTVTDRISHTLPNGVEIPVELVRGWYVTGHRLIPLDGARMFDAHCTDAASGEPLPPEHGVEYTGAPEIDLTAIPRP